MSAQLPASADLLLRYRPCDDILVAQTDLDGLPGLIDVAADEVEQVDADCTIRWTTLGSVRVLRSLHVIAPAARLRQGRLPQLPPAVSDAVAELVASSPRPARAAEGHLVATTVTVLLDGLSPVEQAPPASDAAPIAVSRSLAAALVHLADAIAGEVDTTSYDRLPAHRFITVVRELADVISAHRRPAPGVGAAAVELVRGGLPLASSERMLLRTAFADIDRPGTWRAVARSLDALAHTIDDQRRLREDDR